MSTSVRGACLCGAVAFSVAPPYRWLAHCHCSMCRKHHGSLFGTSVGVARAALRWLGGADEIVHYRATAAFERPFCRRCGATVPALSHDEGYWNVPAGLLDDDPSVRPRTHIFAASRSPLYEIADDLPQHAAYPPGIALPIVETPRARDASAALRGSCLCGAVAFTAAITPRRLVNCYCPLCRRGRAAAFSSTLLVAKDAFRWEKGGERVRRYTLPAAAKDGVGIAHAGAMGGLHRSTDFCADCGSLAPSVTAGSSTVMLPAGAIDTPLPRLPAVHLYAGSKAAWYEIHDAWPQFAELPPPQRFTELFQ